MTKSMLAREVEGEIHQPFMEGSIQVVYRKCGKRNCRCTTGKRNLHGPYYQYCFYENGKLKRELVPEEKLPMYKAMIERGQKLAIHVKQLATLHRSEARRA